jgi:hypothetical protein
MIIQCSKVQSQPTHIHSPTYITNSLLYAIYYGQDLVTNQFVVRLLQFIM